MMSRPVRIAGLVAALGLGAATPVLAGPDYSFRLELTEVGAFGTTGVGTVYLSQIDADTVRVEVDLDTDFGFVNTGGHTPFTFEVSSIINAANDLVIAWTTPPNGEFEIGGDTESFALNQMGGASGFPNPPFPRLNTAIENTAGNGNANAYEGDLDFTLSRAGGIDTNDFVGRSATFGSEMVQVYFTADVVKRRGTGAGTTGAVAAVTRVVDVPAPGAALLFGVGLLGLFALRRRG